MYSKSKKAQMGMVGTMILLAVALIVGTVLITDGISDSAAVVTTTVDVVNDSVTAPAIGSSINLNGQAARNLVVINGTSGTVIPASNYTVANYVVSNGQLVTTLTANAGTSIGWQGKAINVSYTYEPFGYATDSGSRAITGLIVLFAALALVVVAVSVVIKNGGIAFK